ncbi:MAG: SpoIID/LytB domain-containing protein [Planctomycetaceae bacterium]
MLVLRRMAWSVMSLVACLGLLWAIPRFGLLNSRSGPTSHERFREDFPERATLSLRGGFMASEPSIRVGLKESPVASFMLAVNGPFQVRDLTDERVLWQAKSLPRCRVVVGAKGIELGNQRFATGSVEVVAATPPAIWVDQAQYRGSLRITRAPGNRVLPVNVLPLEQYLASVVDSEMPAAFPEEARRAQAIVARTYALYQRLQSNPKGFVDVYASTRSQKYRGYQYEDEKGRLLAGESASSRATVEATRGLIGTHRGDLFCTYYCAVCGGSTVDGQKVFPDAAPPLQSVLCDHCREARLYRWQVRVARREAEELFRAAARKKGKTFGTLRELQGIRGRLGDYRLRDQQGEIELTGAEIRQALSGKGLSSPRFTIREQGNELLFEGQGHGHGVGLCQWGARGLAQQGWTARRIFAYYYPGSQLADAGYR